MKKGFPVKTVVPLTMTIRANITFKEFSKINDPASLPAEHFSIPADYKLESRKVAQKILERQKKRVLLANVLL